MSKVKKSRGMTYQDMQRNKQMNRKRKWLDIALLSLAIGATLVAIIAFSVSIKRFKYEASLAKTLANIISPFAGALLSFYAYWKYFRHNAKSKWYKLFSKIFIALSCVIIILSAFAYNCVWYSTVEFVANFLIGVVINLMASVMADIWQKNDKK